MDSPAQVALFRCPLVKCSDCRRVLKNDFRVARSRRQLHESKATPARKVKKTSVGESPGIPADPPPKQSQKRVSRVKKQEMIDDCLAESPGDSLLALLGRSALGDSPGDSFLSFRAGTAFDSCTWSAGSGNFTDKNIWPWKADSSCFGLSSTVKSFHSSKSPWNFEMHL